MTEYMTRKLSAIPALLTSQLDLDYLSIRISSSGVGVGDYQADKLSVRQLPDHITLLALQSCSWDTVLSCTVQ